MVTEGNEESQQLVAQLADERAKFELEIEDLESLVVQVEGTLTELAALATQAHQSETDRDLHKLMKHRQ